MGGDCPLPLEALQVEVPRPPKVAKVRQMLSREWV